MRKENGITLVSLVVTIIILILLVGISINLTLGENGIITKARQAKENTELAEIAEQEKLNELYYEIEQEGSSNGSGSNENDGESDNSESKEIISTTDSYVGYYADIDNDGTVDGVIYADLLVGGSGLWGNNGTYFIYTITSAKEYYISQTEYTGKFGTNAVLTPVSTTSTDNDRFYIMALSDISNSVSNGMYWYNSAYGNMSDYLTTTFTAFGSGKTNTKVMMEKWKAKSYGDQDEMDIWGLIQDEVDNGWFIPSKEEWAAFADAFNIETTTSSGSISIGISSNVYSYGLKNYYWSSSQSGENTAWLACLYWSSFTETTTSMNNGDDVEISSVYGARLSATF